MNADIIHNERAILRGMRLYLTRKRAESFIFGAEGGDLSSIPSDSLALYVNLLRDSACRNI